MDRAALLAYLAAEWSEVITKSGVDPAYIVDRVEAVYVAQPDLDAGWAEPLADYYLLRRVVNRFALDFDVTIDGNTFRLSQRKDLAKMLALREAEVAWIVSPGGYATDTIGKVVTISAPYLTGVDPWAGEYE